MRVMDEFTWVWRKEINVRLSEPPHLLSKWLLLIWCLNIWCPQFLLPLNRLDVCYFFTFYANDEKCVLWVWRKKIVLRLSEPLIYHPNGCSLFDAFIFDAPIFDSHWIDWMFDISLHFMPMMRNGCDESIDLSMEKGN